MIKKSFSKKIGSRVEKTDKIVECLEKIISDNSLDSNKFGIVYNLKESFCLSNKIPKNVSKVFIEIEDVNINISNFERIFKWKKYQI